MKRLICILLTLLLVLSMSVTAFAAEFAIDQYAEIDGMSQSWYQGYGPTIKDHKMTLCLPVTAQNCVGDITVSLALNDPNVFLLTEMPREVTVSPQNGIYPVKLILTLERYRRNGDFPATFTIKGTDGAGKEIMETIPYVIRIRDGYGSHETMEPVSGLVRWALRQANGSIVSTGEEAITVPALSSHWLEDLVFDDATLNDHYVSFEFLSGGQIISEGTALFCAPKHFNFADPALTVRMEGDEIIVTAAAFAKSVCIESDDPDLLLTDNFFDLNPGEKRVKVLRGSAQNLRVRSVFDMD